MQKWFDRIFTFSEANNTLPATVIRLSATPQNVHNLIQAVPAEKLIAKDHGAWSIQENIGHLIDLEPLWQGRLDDILDGAKVLRAADLSNQKTHLAKHNDYAIADLLDQFRTAREETIRRLRLLTEEQSRLSALHPRLRTPMRTMDLFFFVAEHDDHHLATIARLLKESK